MKKSYKTNLKGQKAITLIALIITVLVLLILAGVTMSMVLGDEGIIAQAQAAKSIQEEAAEESFAEGSETGFEFYLWCYER